MNGRRVCTNTKDEARRTNRIVAFATGAVSGDLFESVVDTNSLLRNTIKNVTDVVIPKEEPNKSVSASLLLFISIATIGIVMIQFRATKIPNVLKKKM